MKYRIAAALVILSLANFSLADSQAQTKTQKHNHKKAKIVQPADQNNTAGPQVKKYQLQVTPTINKKVEEAKVSVYKYDESGAHQFLVDQASTVGGKPATFTLDEAHDYRVEATFARVGESVAQDVDSLSKDTAVNLNLEYYTISVTSNLNNATDIAAAAKIIIYNRGDQAHPVASGHTDSYSPAKFFLPARKSYVVRIVYDNGVSKNVNGQVIYSLQRDTAITFNYDQM